MKTGLLLLIALLIVSTAFRRSEESPSMDPGIDSAALYKRGQALFAGCTSCHSLDRRSTGTALKYIGRRTGYAWFAKWVRSPSMMIAEKDPRAVRIFKENGGVHMTAFPLKDADMLALYYYIDEESKKLGPWTGPDGKACCDSCSRYRKSLSQAYQKEASIQESNGHFIDIQGIQWTAPEDLPEDLQDKSGPFMQSARLYKFTLQFTGWRDLSALNSASQISTALRIADTDYYSVSSQTMLLLPERKVVLKAGYVDRESGSESSSTGFYNQASLLPLSSGETGILIGMAELDNKIVFGWKIIHLGYPVERLPLQTAGVKSSLDALSTHLAGMGVTIRLDPTGGQSEILRLEQHAESLAPRNCYCDCRFGN